MYSEFVFDPIKWQRKQMNKDFLDLSKMFNAVKSLVRVPSVDPKYKIVVLASKQVFAMCLPLFLYINFKSCSLLFSFFNIVQKLK